MRNPRPCVCGHPESVHRGWLHRYVGVERDVPLRSPRQRLKRLRLRLAKKEAERKAAIQQEDDEWMSLVFAMWDADDEPEPGQPRRLP